MRAILGRGERSKTMTNRRHISTLALLHALYFHFISIIFAVLIHSQTDRLLPSYQDPNYPRWS